ncbi:MAG: preprotein translocase subunit YajC [Planctomycetota bacterium]|nr:MAG: preprotein translocase subunit YajC [Planctomycetota bacterium]
MNNIWILAQTAEQEGTSRVTSEPVTSEGEAITVVPDSNAPAAKAPPARPFGGGTWVWLVLMLVFMYFILFRGPRRKQQQLKQMVESLKKNDRVRTIGGILGTVVDIKGDEITLKVDESNNTKIKVASSAIGKKLSKDEN